MRGNCSRGCRGYWKACRGMFQDISTKTKVYVGFFAPILLTLGLGISIVQSFETVKTANNKVVEAETKLVGLKDLETSVLDMETGMRGFLLAGEETFLEPYLSGVEETLASLLAMQIAAADLPEQLVHLEKLNELLREWQQEVAAPNIELRRAIASARTMNEIEKLVQEGYGKTLFGIFRQKIARFIDREETLLNSRRTRLIATKENVDQDVATVWETLGWVNHTHEVLAASDELLSNAVDMETGMRGFLLTGDDEFLEPYTVGVANFNKNIKTLQRQVRDNSAQVSRVGRLKQIIDTWNATAVQTGLTLRREANSANSGQSLASIYEISSFVKQKGGKSALDAFRAELTEFKIVETELMEVHRDNARGAEAAVLLNLASMAEDREWVSHTYDVIVAANTVLNSAIDMETGMRGYLLAGDETFLEPFNAGIMRFRETIDVLAADVADNPAQVALLREAKQAIRAWQIGVSTPRILLRREIGTAANMTDLAAQIAQSKGKTYIDEMRRNLGSLEAIFESQITAEIAGRDETRANAYSFLIGVVAASLLLGLFLAWTIGRTIVDPLLATKKAVESMAAGNRWARIEDLGRKDEIGLLMSAFNDMADERLLWEEKVLASKADAERSSRTKSDFLANMSHEIRTPMNGIIGATGLLLDTALSSKQRTFADTTMKSAHALLSLVNDILDLSKIEADKLEFEAIPFNLQHLIEDVAELMSVKCAEKNIELLLRFRAPNTHLTIGDPGRVRQILLNLISNAVKFTDKGYVLLTVSEEGGSGDMRALLFEVQDTGVGIPKDKQAMIFKAFDQADTSTTRKYGGTGLGLSITEKLVTQMGGEVGLKSAVGEGSTFWYTLVLGRSEELIVAQKKYDLALLHDKKILVVDDCEVAHLIVGEQLRGHKMQMAYTQSPLQALNMARLAASEGKPYDMLLTDLCMPELSGDMLVAEIRRTETIADLVVVIMTSAPRAGDGAQMKDLGVSAYLTKPIFPGEITAVMAAIFSAKAANKSIPLLTRHAISERQSKTKEIKQFRGAQILLAEDNAVNQMVATHMLEKLGCTVTPAGNGLEALKMAGKYCYDLIFMDCQMPEMDGFEATNAIRGLEAGTNSRGQPIVALTANAMTGFKEKCLEAGMNDYVSKPILITDLEHALTEWLPDTFITIASPLDAPEMMLDPDAIDALRVTAGDDFTVLLNTYNGFSADTKVQVVAAIKAEDADALLEHAHAFKGCAVQIGAHLLAELARELEILAADKDFSKGSELAARFTGLCDQVEAAVNVYVEEEEKHQIAS